MLFDSTLHWVSTYTGPGVLLSIQEQLSTAHLSLWRTPALAVLLLSPAMLRASLLGLPSQANFWSHVLLVREGQYGTTRPSIRDHEVWLSFYFAYFLLTRCFSGSSQSLVYLLLWEWEIVVFDCNLSHEIAVWDPYSHACIIMDTVLILSAKYCSKYHYLMSCTPSVHFCKSF